MEAKYTRKMQALRDEMDLRRKTEIHELEERKNTQISELMENHEGAFGAIKNYYNDITAKNLTLINLLKVLPVPVSPLHPGIAPARVDLAVLVSVWVLLVAWHISGEGVLRVWGTGRLGSSQEPAFVFPRTGAGG